MADGPIDSLSIEIGASSTKAVNGIKKLTEALQALKGAMKGEGGETFDKLKKFADAMNSLKDVGNIKLSNKLPDQLRNISKAVSEVSDDTIRKLNEMTAAIERLNGIDLRGFSNAVKVANKSSTQAAAASVSKPAKTSSTNRTGGATIGGVTARGNTMSAFQMADEIWGALSPAISLKQQIQIIKENIKNSNIGKFADALKSASNYAGKIAKSIGSFAKKKIKLLWDKSAFSGIEKSIGRIKNVINSFSRIAFYRAIRSAIKYVTDALKEGVENAYHYSREYGEATSYIADAYDRISSSEFKMSNQLGAAWATMIAYIEPIIIRIINLVTRAADAVTQFFAILSGKGTYLKAADYNKQWADSATGAAKAAEEWKNQLMGFDEINRLEEPSDGGGGGGGKAGLNYGDMFEETAKNLFFEQLRDAFENGQWALMGQLLGDKFNEIVDMVDWKKYGKKLGQGLNASITVAYNFLKTADFKNLGVRLSEFVNSALNQVNFDQAGRTWMRLRLTLLDFLMGIVDGMDWRMLAIKLSNFIIGSLDELAEWLRGLKPETIANALKDFFGNIKYEEIGAALKEVFSLAVESALSVFDVLGLDGKTVKMIAEIALGVTALGLALKGIVTVVGAVNTAISLLTSPVGLVILGLTALVAAGVLVYQNWDTIKETATRVFGPMLTGIKTTIDGIKNVFSGLVDFVAGVFTGDWSRAWNGIKNVFVGVVEVVIGNIQTMFGWLRSLIDGVASAISWIRGLFDHMNALANSNAARIQADGSIYMQGFATGGFPEDGLFMANHGELVGQFSNGRTAVANNEQIVAGISAGVFDAVVAAFSQTGGNNGGSDRPVNIYLDGKVIAQSTTKYQNQFARAKG